MSNLDTLLPQRNLRFVRKPLSGGLALLLLCLLPLVGALALAWYQVPDIWRDAGIRSHAVELEDYELRNGECRTRKGVFTDCSAEVAYEVDGVAFEREIDLMFLSFGGGDYEASLVVDARDPGQATLSLGIEKFWNRVVMLVGMVLLIGGAGLFGALGALKTMRDNRTALQPQRWVPMVVVVQSAQKAMGGTNVQYVFDRDGKQKREGSRFGRKEAPLYLQADDGTPLALAVRPVTGGPPMLLDDALTRLDLTAAERAHAQAVLGAPAADTDLAAAPA